MLNTIFRETGLQLNYVKEVFTSFLPINTVGQILKDGEEREYLLIISFDPLQDFWIEWEAENLMPVSADRSLGLIWSGEVLYRKCSLYRGSLANSQQDTFQQKQDAVLPVTKENLACIQENFLKSYPRRYWEQIKAMEEYRQYFSLLAQMASVAVGRELGFSSTDQIALLDGRLEPKFCQYGIRKLQPLGYDEYLWRKLTGNMQQKVTYPALNAKKHSLIIKIQALIRMDCGYCVKLSQDSAREYDAQGFALNHYSVLYPDHENAVLQIENSWQRLKLPLSIHQQTAQIGTWMNNLGREPLLAAIQFIFRTYRQVRYIEYQNVLCDLLVDHGWRHNDFYVPIPGTIEELKKTLSSKGRYNLKRERRILGETFRGIQLKDIPYEQATEDMLAKFYEFKNETHGVSSENYDIRDRHLTNIYLLTLGEDDVRGVAISCEQGDVVFLENHTFDSTMRSFSVGQVMYDMFLDAMVLKGKKGVALAGGSLEYKKRYGSMCAIARSGRVNRYSAWWMRICKKIGVPYDSRCFLAVVNVINKYIVK